MLLTSPKTTFFSVLTLLSLPFSALADRSWDDANSPGNFDATYIKEFSQLPLSGAIDPDSKRAWADSYWPKVNGLIADRWQVKGSFYKDDKSPSPYRINSMSESEIDLLSPAEKFDIARGRLNFPIATYIREKQKTNQKDWRGLCNGWTHASLNIDEPNAIVYINPTTQQRIPFGSGDLKGLMSYYYAKRDDNSAKYIGRACKPLSRFLFNLNGACSDVHPAAFHIMMANELGIRHQGFAADRDPTIEVWNQPFVKFESRVDNVKNYDLSKKATDGTRKEVYITSILTYVNEIYNTTNPLEENSTTVTTSYTPVIGTDKQAYRTTEYKYVLELNSRDRIIGGEWLTDNHPDLIWKQKFELPGVVKDDENKRDDWSLLAELIKMATAQ